MSLLWQQLGQGIYGEQPGDQSGFSVSLSSDGTTFAVGALDNDGNGTSSGNVRVYYLSNNSWVQRGQDIDGEASSDLAGFSVSLSADGNTVAVGAILNDGINTGNSNDNRGSVRVYDFTNNSTWIKRGQDIDGQLGDDLSGFSVSLSENGDTVAIGAINNDNVAGSNSGSTSVYKWNNINSWIQVGQTINGLSAGSNSGYSVSLSANGNTIAIGDININYNSGLVRIFDISLNSINNTSTWIQRGSSIFGESVLDYSGFSVSLSSNGNVVAIGATGNDGVNGIDSGSVRVYYWNNFSWIKRGQDIDGEAAYDNFGFSVSLNADGNTVAISSRLNDGNTGVDVQMGSVRIYDFTNNSTWIKRGQDIDGENTNWGQFGFSVSLSSNGNIVAIGGIGNDGGGDNSGSVRVFKYGLPTIANISWNTPTLATSSIVTITGTNFTTDAIVSFAGTNIIPISVSSNTITCNLPLGTSNITVTTQDGSAQTSILYTVLNSIFANVCFPKGTPIVTDQGLIEIQKINPEKNTIRGKQIVTITETVTPDKYLVCFEKDSLGPNIPSQKTVMTKNHCIFYKGEMVKAEEFLNKFENIKKVKYNGEPLYNVLLKTHDKMMVNNLICETLSPKNRVARLYYCLNLIKPEERESLIEEFNKYSVIKNKKSYITK